MQISSRTYFKVAVVFLGLLLSLGVYMAMSSATEEANALSASEWTRVRGYLDSFITSQYTADTVDGESGFTIDAATLRSRTDSNGDGVYLGEGDDAANAPVLVDVLNGYGGTFIQATSVMTTWNTTATDAATTSLIASKVTSHEAAGFSTDIVTYCLTGHTESVVAGAMGAIAQAGGYGSTTPSKVLGLKWGRWGWNSGSAGYTYTNALAAPAASPGYATATNSSCTGVTPDSELVRCTANTALATVGSGTLPGNGTGYGTRQAVDIRPGAIGSTVGTGGPNYQVPIDTVFNTGLTDINPGGTQKIVVSRTQHTAGMVAVGLKMLGYNATFSKWGLAKYDSTLPEKFTGGAGYGLVATVIDNTAPTILATPTATAGETTASISLSTDEPATTKVDYGTTAGGPYTNTLNDTVLNANSTANLSGLTPGTTYYAIVTACDGQANCTAAAEISFTTTCTGSKPALTLQAPAAYWATMADYTNGVLSVDWTIVNNGSNDASNVGLTGSSSTYAPITTLTTMPVSYGTITGGGGSALGTVQYQLPSGFAGAGFHVINAAAATDQCGTGYTYP